MSDTSQTEKQKGQKSVMDQATKESIEGFATKIFKLGQKKAENSKLKDKVKSLSDKVKELKSHTGKGGTLSEVEKKAKGVVKKVAEQKSNATIEGFDKIVGKMPRTSSIPEIEKLVYYGLEILAQQPPKVKTPKVAQSSQQ